MKYGLIVASALVGICGYEWICWSKIDAAAWAAWVQAIGSIGAILVAIFVVNLQHRREKIESKLQVLRKEASLVSVAWMYSNEFEALVKSINKQIGTGIMVKTSVLIAFHTRVTSCLLRIESLPVWEMGIGEAALISALKTLADCTANAISVQGLDGEFQPNNFGVALVDFETRAGQITDALKKQYEGLKQFLYLGSLDDLPKTW